MSSLTSEIIFYLETPPTNKLLLDTSSPTQYYFVSPCSMVDLTSTPKLALDPYLVCHIKPLSYNCLDEGI